MAAHSASGLPIKTPNDCTGWCPGKRSVASTPGMDMLGHALDSVCSCVANGVCPYTLLCFVAWDLKQNTHSLPDFAHRAAAANKAEADRLAKQKAIAEESAARAAVQKVESDKGAARKAAAASATAAAAVSAALNAATEQAQARQLAAATAARAGSIMGLGPGLSLYPQLRLQQQQQQQHTRLLPRVQPFRKPLCSHWPQSRRRSARSPIRFKMQVSLVRCRCFKEQGSAISSQHRNIPGNRSSVIHQGLSYEVCF